MNVDCGAFWRPDLCHQRCVEDSNSDARDTAARFLRFVNYQVVPVDGCGSDSRPEGPQFGRPGQSEGPSDCRATPWVSATSCFTQACEAATYDLRSELTDTESHGLSGLNNAKPYQHIPGRCFETASLHLPWAIESRPFGRSRPKPSRMGARVPFSQSESRNSGRGGGHLALPS